MNKWLWLLYPLLVIGFVVFSLNYGLNDADKWQKLFGQQNNSDEQLQKAARLQVRLGELANFDLEQGNKDLAELVLAVPAAKRVWVLISEVKAAASESGIEIEKYKAVVGDVKEASGSAAVAVAPDVMRLEVELTAVTMDRLWSMLDRLENVVPLVKVVSVKLAQGSLTLVVEGAWGGWNRVASDINYPLPQYAGAWAQVKGKIEQFNAFTQVADVSSLGTGGGVVDPF